MSARSQAASVATSLSLMALVLSAAGPALAIAPEEMLPNPAQEARARAIGKELRCLVCQNESIDDSDADLARDLRRLVRQRVAAGDSDRQVEQYIVDRYGNYVLLKPPFIAETWLLWLGPLILLGGAGWLVRNAWRRPDAPAPDSALSAEETLRLATLIGAPSKDPRP